MFIQLSKKQKLHQKKMVEFFFSLLFLSFIFSNCSRTIKKNLSKKGEIVISSKVIGNLKLVKINNKEYLNFSDFKTYKKTELNDISSNEKYSYDLSPIINAGYQIESVEFISLDSILILTKYQNKVIVSNKLGDFLNEYNFSEFDGIKNKFELMPYKKSFLLNDSTFLFSLEYQNDKDSNYYKNRLVVSRLLKITNFNNDSPESVFGLKSLYANFSDETDLTIEGNNYFLLDDEILFFSAYSDTLYSINTITLKIVRKTKINSKFSDVHINPVKIEEQLNGSKDLNINFKSNGQIRNIFYNSDQKLYYLFVSHKPKKTSFPWSIIILDVNFEKINEIKMDETKYSCNGIMTSQGLLISNYPQYKNDKNVFEKSSFSIFAYE